MAIEKKFVKEGIKESQMEDFLRKRFDRAGYSHTEIQQTPLGTRIIVYANKPGLVIGRSGRRVNEITGEIKRKFGFENPLVDVREVDNPFLDANIVANRIAKALERGIHYKRVCNFYLEKVMEAGAIGVQIEASGKLAGVERSRFQKFKDGFIAHSGDYAEKLVDKGYAQSNLKPGIAGIKVKIMLEAPKEFIAEKRIEKQEEAKEDTESEVAEESEKAEEGEEKTEAKRKTKGKKKTKKPKKDKKDKKTKKEKETVEKT